MSKLKVGDRVRIVIGTTKRCRKSSMAHWRMVPDIDGEVFTIERLTPDGKGCCLNLPNLAPNLYELPFRCLEVV